MLKYLHLEKGTRLVRSVVGRTLQTSDWRPHFVQLVDWTNSSDQLDLLSARLFGHSDVRQAGKIENAKMEMTN